MFSKALIILNLLKKKSLKVTSSGKVKGFTLVELLVVISIIALLLSILMPSLNSVRAQAKRVACGSNIKNMGLGVVMYQHDYKGNFPTILWNPWMDKPNYWQGQLSVYLGWTGNADMTFTYATKTTRDLSKYPDRLLNIFRCPSVKSSEKTRSVWGHSYGINHYLWSTAIDTAHPNRKIYWHFRELKRPKTTFLLIDDSYYTVGDPAALKAVPVHYKRTKNVLYADNHLGLGYRDTISDLLWPLGWYDSSIWGDTITTWANYPN